MNISKLATDSQKRGIGVDRVFHNVLRVGALVVLVVWIIESNADLTQRFDDIGYGITITVILLIYFISYYLHLVNMAKILVFTYAAIYLLTLTVLGFLQSASDGTLYSIASSLQWIPIIYILAFLFLENRAALIGALCVYLFLVTMLVLTYTGLLPFRNLDLRILMVNMALSHGLYIICMFAVVQLKSANRRQSDIAIKLEKAANQDSLLGIANRRYLQSLMDQFSGSGMAVAILLVDVDHFKTINDNHGHTAGDKILKQIVKQIQTSLRPVDVLGRWGGEEFLILADITQEGALSLAKRVCLEVRSHFADQPIPVTVSIGVADYEGVGDMERTINQADKALYQAKHQGRNRAVLYS